MTSMWTPSGVHQEFIRSPSGVYQESIRSSSGVHQNFIETIYFSQDWKAVSSSALSVKYTDLVRVYEVDKSPKMSVARILGGLYYITEGVRWADWKFSIKLSEHVRA